MLKTTPNFEWLVTQSCVTIQQNLPQLHISSHSPLLLKLYHGLFTGGN